jgi:hypothetical protein
MSEIDSQRKKVAILAVSICTLNMPFMLLVEHARNSKFLPALVIFYVLAMSVLIAYTILELKKYQRSKR